MTTLRTRRVLSAAVAVLLAVGILGSQVLTASAEETRSVDVAVVRVDNEGYPIGVTLNEFTRAYNDNGSTDSADAIELTLENGLVKVGDDLKALPVSVRTHYFLDGVEVSAKEIAGKAGDFRVEWRITNRTQKTETLTYTNSATGEERTVTAATMVPFTVELADLALSDAAFDDLTSNGIVSRSAGNDASEMSWTAVLAPPVFPGTALFSLEGKTNAFKLPGTQIVATPGIAGALPQAADDAAEKGGATAATLRGYVTQFGDGFGQLGNGLGQLKGGVDQIFTGINGTLKPAIKNPTFDAALFAEDSTLAYNQPGLMQALELLGAGLDAMADGAKLVRGGLKTGDAANPGVTEGLQQVIAGIGLGNEFDGGGNPLTVRASLNALRVGMSSGDMNSPGMVEGLQKIQDAIGAGTEFAGSTPLTLRASINAVRAGLSSGDANNPAIIEGLEKIYASIGDGTEFAGTTPLTVAAGLAAVRGGLSSGDMNNPAIIEGLQTIYNSIGAGTEFSGETPLTLAASLAAVRAALSSGDANNPAILEGLQQIYAGIGAGNEFSGQTPLTVRASLNAIRGALSTGSQVDPGLIEGVQQVVAGMAEMSTQLDVFAQSFTTAVDAQLTNLLLPGLSGSESAVTQGVLDAGIVQLKAALSQMSAGLSSGDFDNPGVLEGLQTIYAAIGDGSEFSGETPMSVAASLVAMRAGLSSGSDINPAIIEGVQKVFAAVGDGTEFSGSTPLTIRAGLNAMRAGLSSGDVDNPAVLEGLQQIFDSIGEGDEFTSGIPTTLRASLNAIRAGLSSGDINNPAIIEGLETIYASLGLGNEFNGATPLTIQAGLVALQQGAAQLEGGAQLAHDSIGSGAAGEFAPDGSPMTVQAALVAIGAGLDQLVGGIGQIVTGLGDVDANGDAVKSVTTRVTKFGNTIESPATLLYGLDSAKDTVMTKFVVGVGLLVDALGDPNVSAPTILYGLKAISDGLALAGEGGTAGASGASTISQVLASTVAKSDMTTALHQAGLARADSYFGLKDHDADNQRTLFIFRNGGVA